ncbi:hypothetical protein XH94_15340 [Bradyrhizobium zhanjiangense]|uniref:Uncharacterized protein n=1 Tax=Bradyrhizobium zhanjiangense TaxID=1325107 RepID=A0A4Q0SPP0_9BRAD|nr:hypothetical protein XH94_15340 [Bradyrhizobium zhanjiangense]
MRSLPEILIVPSIYFNLQIFATKAPIDSRNGRMATGPKIALSIKLSLPIAREPVSIKEPSKRIVACRSLRQ